MSARLDDRAGLQEAALRLREIAARMEEGSPVAPNLEEVAEILLLPPEPDDEVAS